VVSMVWPSDKHSMPSPARYSAFCQCHPLADLGRHGRFPERLRNPCSSAAPTPSASTSGERAPVSANWPPTEPRPVEPPRKPALGEPAFVGRYPRLQPPCGGGRESQRRRPERPQVRSLQDGNGERSWCSQLQQRQTADRPPIGPEHWLFHVNRADAHLRSTVPDRLVNIGDLSGVD